MNRGKTANILTEDFIEEIDDYLEQRETEKEDLELINSFRKFCGYFDGNIGNEEILYSD